ncbi:siderophore iron transporter-like protein mirB [Lizonia empirigonia]|nr:siderophore iron transporter-like protein mirB [Lizonia empirigonia]
MSLNPDGPQPTSGIERLPPQLDTEKTGHTVAYNSNPESLGTNEYDIDGEKPQDFQRGVERIRIITSIWNKPTLISMFVLLYLIHFVDMLQNYIDSGLNPYVTSAFASHGLLTVGTVISTALGGCVPLTMAKAIDIWGRVEGFCLMLLICVLGMIVKAVCTNVQSYIGGHILYWTGHIGLLYVIDVMCADITSLKNRMIIFGINGTPRIAATFAGPKLVEIFYNGPGWRWAFGAFIIILVACSVPAMTLMLYMYRKARQSDFAQKQRSGRTTFQSLKFYLIEFDIFGIILLMAAFCLFMLPEPTIVGSCALYGVMFLSVFCWNAMFNSYLQVVHRQSITNAGYILNSFLLTSSVFGPLIGMLISYTGNFKWIAMTGVPITLLGTCLLIPFRTPSTNPGVLAFTQILVGLGTGIFATCGQLAIMAPVTHQQIAVVNALWGLFGGFGSSIGYSIAGAMWNGITPGELYKRLPEGSKDQAAAIFGDLVLQMSFADGMLKREAVVGAYAHSQRLMVIAGAAFIPLCVASIFIWKNINVKKLEEEQGKQTKGLVF